MTLQTMNPTGVKSVDLHSVAPRLESLNGATVGVLHNAKKNSKELLMEMVGVLAARFEIKEVIGPEPTDQPMLSSSQQLDDLARRCDVVITGVGD